MIDIIEKTISNLEKNNMQGIYLATKEEVVPFLQTLIPKKSTVAVGGSMTLFECGVIDHLRSGRYEFYDRYKDGIAREETREVFLESFRVKTYLTSANAITQDGCLYNVDGNSNRTGSILFGPESVIVIAGVNKIVKNIDEAICRVKTISAPLNAKRLGAKTYCAKNGKCVSLLKANPQIYDGCNTSERICCNYVVSAYQRVKDRISVIIVGEDLGF